MVKELVCYLMITKNLDFNTPIKVYQNLLAECGIIISDKSLQNILNVIEGEVITNNVPGVIEIPEDFNLKRNDN